ncbi:MAG TPA: hypothetical protein VKU91_02980 [Acidimicrobiales bacterium]|nr:hypothetical protein [Acidimicrobiales bacterium]
MAAAGTLGALGAFGVGTASAQTCGYNAANCTPPSVTTPSSATPSSGTSPAVPSAAASASGTSSLAFTGFDATLTALAGVGAIGAGTVLVRRARQRA